MKIQVTDGDSSKISFNGICTMHKHLKLIHITVISNPVMFTRMCIMSMLLSIYRKSLHTQLL